MRNADALIRILSAVLEISRSEALTGRNQFAGFDLGELAAELAEMYDPLADERGATLRLERPSGPVAFFGHRQLLAQALSNLIENAIRYGSAGRDIAVRVAEREGDVCLQVADRGPGIPPDRHEDALRRFGRLDSSRSEEGAGLGLALARSIAHLHGGELQLEDNGPGCAPRSRFRMPPTASCAERTRRCARRRVQTAPRASQAQDRSFSGEGPTGRQIESKGGWTWHTAISAMASARAAKSIPMAKKASAAGASATGAVPTPTGASAAARSARKRSRWSDRGARFEDYGRHEGRFGGTSHARSFSAHPDDHYRSWRDRHMSELDRDYQDYCREREQQFHRDFDGWRRQKYGNPQPLRTGMTQSGISHDPTGMTQAAEENSPASGNEQSAMTAATLGTNSEGRTRGRR